MLKLFFFFLLTQSKCALCWYFHCTFIFQTDVSNVNRRIQCKLWIMLVRYLRWVFNEKQMIKTAKVMYSPLQRLTLLYWISCIESYNCTTQVPGCVILTLARLEGISVIFAQSRHPSFTNRIKTRNIMCIWCGAFSTYGVQASSHPFQWMCKSAEQSKHVPAFCLHQGTLMTSDRNVIDRWSNNTSSSASPSFFVW